MYGRCKKCGKKLTDPESRLRGYGPECWEELVAAVKAKMDEEENSTIPGQITIFEYMEQAKGRS